MENKMGTMPMKTNAVAVKVATGKENIVPQVTPIAARSGQVFCFTW